MLWLNQLMQTKMILIGLIKFLKSYFQLSNVTKLLTQAHFFDKRALLEVKDGYM